MNFELFFANFLLLPSSEQKRRKLECLGGFCPEKLVLAICSKQRKYQCCWLVIVVFDAKCNKQNIAHTVLLAFQVCKNIGINVVFLVRTSLKVTNTPPI